MSFDFSTLVTDRTQADVSRVKQVAEKIKNGTASESELAEFNNAAMKGAYNYTDLNRVTAAMEALKAKLEGYGYAVPGYQRIKVPHVLPEPEPTSRLPEGYTELTYIESTGTQYIDAGFKPNQDTRVVMDSTILKVNGQYADTLFGVRTSSSSKGYYLFIVGYGTTTETWQFGYNNGSSTGTLQRVGRHFVDMNKNTVTIDTLSISRTYATFQTDYNLFLFNINQAGTVAVDKYAVMRLHSCQIYDNGTLVRDYVPCINPDGAIGLYDLVTAAFFGNSGTGAFVAGAIPRELPEGYTQVEYIESTGTQHIDTGVKPNGNSRVVLSGYNLSASSKWVFGSWHNWYTNEFGFNFEEGSSAANGFRYGSTSAGVSGVPLGAFYLDHNGAVYTFNNTKGTMTAQQFTSNYSMYLFRFNAAGNASSGYFVGRIYYCKIYDNGALIRDFVPCKNNAGVLGFYDFANDAFYQNAGSGTFVAGNEVAAPVAVAMSVANVIDETEYDPHTWYEFDWPTPETMTVYLLNVSAIRAVLVVLRSTPEVPTDMERLMMQGVNDIEAILLDVYRQLTIMPTTFIACGEAICGGDNL